MIKAKIIADSKNQFGDRITTFVVTFPRIILAEVNTHRMFSRNSASSRAIPFEKMLKMVEENPFIPIKWMKDHKGMQGNVYFNEDDKFDNGVRFKSMPQALLDNWLAARNNAVSVAKSMSEKGLTKQIVNRLLEPFMWHTAIISATEWENFFALRNHEAAEIHLQELANLMMIAYNESTPNELKEGEWHIPFGDKIDEDNLHDYGIVELDNIYDIDELKIAVATARCARVSYLNHEGKDDYEADLKLYDQLSTSGHWSAFEHCAKAMTKYQYKQYAVNNYISDISCVSSHGWCGNFKGFIQLRKTFENENRKDSRVIKK
jgi:thymidylate synthase ThyX